MTSPEQTVNVTVGSALTLMVDITEFNLPLTSITWMEDGQVLMNNTDNIIITHGSFAAPPTTSTLVRDPIQSPMDNGTYEITVVNPAGENMTTYTVTVNGKELMIVTMNDEYHDEVGQKRKIRCTPSILFLYMIWLYNYVVLTLFAP